MVFMNWYTDTANYHDSIHNHEYHYFYYRDSIIFTITQAYLVVVLLLWVLFLVL